MEKESYYDFLNILNSLFKFENDKLKLFTINKLSKF